MEDSTFSFNQDNNATVGPTFSNGTTMEFESVQEQPAKIKVIGVGGGGGNAVNHMFRQGIRGVDFIVCNTDAKALSASPVPVKIELGKLGAGNVPERARKLALEHKDEIRNAISDDTQMLFITAGMGGGTGTGAAPVIAEIAKSIELDDEMVPRILVVAIVTMPFIFEGKLRMKQALDGIEELKKHVDAILVINNDKLRDLYGNLTFSAAFSKADDVLLTAAKGIAEIITVPGYVNIDFRDVNTVMEKSGTALMGAGQGTGENRARQAIEAATTSVLLNDNDIRGAKNILLYFSYSPEHEISMDEIGEITDYITNLIGNMNATLIWGNSSDESLNDELNITLIATGFEKRDTGTNVIQFPSVDETEKKVDKVEEKPVDVVKEEPVKVTDAESGFTLIRNDVANTVDNSANSVLPQNPAGSSTTQSNNPFDQMASTQNGDKRIITLDIPVEDEAEEETASNSQANVFDNSRMDDIRVFSRDMMDRVQSPADATQQTYTPVMETPKQAPAPTFRIEPTDAYVVPEPQYNVFDTPAQAATQTVERPATVDEQIAKAFTPADDLSDKHLAVKAERIRILNDLLRNNPNGAKIVEEMTTEQLSDGAVYHTPSSSESEASRRRINPDGSVSKGMEFLNFLPD